MTRTLDFPAPSLIAIVAVIFGIIIHEMGLGTSRRLKAAYSITIISSTLANINSVRTLTILLGQYLEDVGNLISFDRDGEVTHQQGSKRKIAEILLIIVEEKLGGRGTNKS